MKTKLLQQTEYDLILKLFFLTALTLLIAKFNPEVEMPKAPVIKINNVYQDTFGNFDQVHISYKTPVILEMVSILKPQLEMEAKKELAEQITKVLKKYKIEPQIVLSIIDTESHFNHELVSSTGDLSMAQVNPDVWNKEFERLKLDPIDPDKLKADKIYSLEVMGRILHILKTRYAKHDRRWYARYHSKTKKHKRVYLSKLERRMKLLESKMVLARN